MNKKIVIAIAAIVVVVLAIFAVKSCSGKKASDSSTTAETQTAESGSVGDETAESESADAETTASENASSDAKATEAGAADAAGTGSAASSSAATDAEASAAGVSGTTGEAPYEHWLAAAVVTAVSMDYVDFEPIAFYTAGDTALANKSSSQGVYFTFTSGGKTYTAYAYPIDALRSDAGTTDIETPVIDKAALNITAGSSVAAGFTETQMDDVNSLIEQSSQVSVYSN